MHPITRKRNWSEIEHASPYADWTIMCPGRVGRINQEAVAHTGLRVIEAAKSGREHEDTYRDLTARVFQMATDSSRLRRTRGVALMGEVLAMQSRATGPFLQATPVAVLLGWSVDLRDRLHIRVVRCEVSPGWLQGAQAVRFGLASWPDSNHFANTHAAVATRNGRFIDRVVWRTLYPELDPPYLPRTFRNGELLDAVGEDWGDPLNWDALADAIEEQGYSPAKVRLASRLLRDMLLRGGVRALPGMAPHS